MARMKTEKSTPAKLTQAKRNKQQPQKTKGRKTAPAADPVYYLIESILDKRWHKGEVEYRVRWKESPPEMGTWETAKKLAGYDAVDAFEAKLEREKKAKLEKETKKAPLGTTPLGRRTARARPGAATPDERKPAAGTSGLRRVDPMAQGTATPDGKKA